MYLPQLATIIASITAFTLMSMKLVIGMMSGSVSVLSSAIDSLLDLFVSLFNLVAVKTAQKPADKKFNYGRGKSEAIASFVEGGVIAISGVYIFVLSSKKIFTSESLELLGPAMSVMIVSIIVTFLLVVFLQHIAKKTDNLVVEADALHYKTDLYTNI
ncbi:MAG: cation diffusion facilitator family transporter [Candidatus Peribacteria bacterium]|nr:MAG: cation diffusion facilitator family transporter [Candidatus Peribacteria bacterium]